MDDWKTPGWLMRLFSSYYDPCPLNGTGGLEAEWGGASEPVFVNPPYSNPLPWVLKAVQEHRRGKTVVLLLKLDCSTRWYRELASAGAHIIFINERLHFSDSDAANFPSMLAILSMSDDL